MDNGFSAYGLSVTGGVWLRTVTLALVAPVNDEEEDDDDDSLVLGPMPIANRAEDIEHTAKHFDNVHENTYTNGRTTSN